MECDAVVSSVTHHDFRHLLEDIELQLDFSMDLYPFFPPESDQTQAAGEYDAESDNYGDSEADILGSCQGHVERLVGHQDLPVHLGQAGPES